jgi:conjugative transfer pilus assembly protein TraH
MKKERFTMLKKVFFLIMTGLTLHITCILSFAGWVDDWITQHTETSPGYYEGQKRGYWTAGSFNARWQKGYDHLFTVMPTKVKSGQCGIDLMLGGFSLLNEDQIVQKFQNILQAAPAAAFDIALKTLCSQCASTIKELEAISSRLNAIQIDDCKASQALVATIAKPFADSGGRREARLAEIQSDFVQSTGLYDLYKEVKDLTTANNNKPIVDLKQAMQGCPQDVKDVFGTGGSVIDNMALKTGFNDSSYTDLIRGYIGDINIQVNSDSYKVSYIPPCNENKGSSLDNFLDGRVFARNDTGDCYQITDTHRDLVNWINNRLTTISAGLKGKTFLSSDDEQFINSIPLPLIMILKTAIGTHQEAHYLATISEVTAKAYAYRMLIDLYNEAYHILEKGSSLLSAQNNAVSGQKAHTCRLEMVDDAIYQIPEMQTKLVGMMKGIRSDYTASAHEINELFSLMRNYEIYDEQSRKFLVEVFGPAVASRVMKGN